MPQLVKKRRSGWAVLAAGALVASILAVGATPAAGQGGLQQPDARSEWLACVGAAKGGGGFTDVDMGSPHYDNINCLAYYGITTGKTADTYDPSSNVTRTQMALFLTRAADKAGIDLGDAMDMGFTDLGGQDAARTSAINVLASKGIMPGRSATTFDPGGLVTRVDMAQHLFTLLDLALDSIHIDTLPMTVDGDGTGIEVNVGIRGNVAGNGQPPNDYFGDVRRTQPVHVADMVNAIYELGITTGTNNMAGEMGTFEPTRPVTRAQMASFIMRAMGFTNLRPAGLTAQQTGTDTQVSVRTADFEPVADQLVELITTAYPDDAFDRNGRCITNPAYVTGTIDGINTAGFGPCSIDPGDNPTDAMGNAVFAVGSQAGSRPTVSCGSNKLTLSGARGAPATVWAWQGDLHDTVDSRNTDLVEPAAANATNPGRATQATVSGGTRNEARMGSTLTYTIQLKNGRGQPVGPIPGANNDYSVTIVMEREDVVDNDFTGTPDEFLVRTTTHSPDSTGKITIPISYPDPRPHRTSTGPAPNDPDVRVSVTVAAATGNDLTLTNSAVSATGLATLISTNSLTAAAVFSDNASVAGSIVATSAPWRLGSSVAGGNRNVISVEVFDQYGELYRANDRSVTPTQTAPASGGAAFTADDSGTDNVDEGAFAVGPSGRASINYSYTFTNSAVGEQQDVTLTLRTRPVTADGSTTPAADVSPAVTGNVTVYWAVRAGNTPGSNADDLVRVGDPAANEIVAQSPSDDTPVAYQYGPDDTFLIEGSPVTLAQFEEVLGSYHATRGPVTSLGNLAWSRYDFGVPRDGAEWRLTGLTCLATHPSVSTP